MCIFCCSAPRSQRRRWDYIPPSSEWFCVSLSMTSLHFLELGIPEDAEVRRFRAIRGMVSTKNQGNFHHWVRGHESKCLNNAFVCLLESTGSLNQEAGYAAASFSLVTLVSLSADRIRQRRLLDSTDFCKRIGYFQSDASNLSTCLSCKRGAIHSNRCMSARFSMTQLSLLNILHNMRRQHS